MSDQAKTHRLKNSGDTHRRDGQCLHRTACGRTITCVRISGRAQQDADCRQCEGA